MITQTEKLQHQSNIILKQFLGEVPLRDGAYSTLEEVETIVAGFDHELTLIFFTSLMNLESESERKAAVMAILEAKLDEFARA